MKTLGPCPMCRVWHWRMVMMTMLNQRCASLFWPCCAYKRGSHRAEHAYKHCQAWTASNLPTHSQYPVISHRRAYHILLLYCSQRAQKNIIQTHFLQLLWYTNVISVQDIQWHNYAQLCLPQNTEFFHVCCAMITSMHASCRNASLSS